MKEKWYNSKTWDEIVSSVMGLLFLAMVLAAIYYGLDNPTPSTPIGFDPSFGK